MSGAETPDADVGTQPARPDELGMDSTSTVRPMATQAIFRPNFDDEDDEPSGGTATTEPDELHHPTVARKLSPTRRLGGGLSARVGRRRGEHGGEDHRGRGRHPRVQHLP